MSEDGRSSTIGAARGYIRRGWMPVPIPARRKQPVTTGWPALRLLEADVPQHFGEHDNIGLILGEPSGGLVDVDLDCPEARELAAQYLPPTPAVTGRPSAPYSHRWYIAEGAKTVKHQDSVDRSMIAELRSTGAQTVVGPSIHPSGEPYDLLAGEPARVPGPMLTACVAALAEAVVRQRHPVRSALEPTSKRLPPSQLHGDPDDVERRALAYLDKLPGAVSGQGGHSATYTAAVALVHGFGIESERALTILLEHYNPRCRPPWTEKELAHKVRDADTKPHERPFGWLRDSERAEARPDPDVDLTGIMECAQSRTPTTPPPAEPEPSDPGPFPESLLRVPGFITAIMTHNLATAHRPQPVLALGGAIALLATLTGRKVCDEADTRTNLYCLGVCPSGMGKEHARQINKDILFLAGAQRMIGPEGLASHAGLIAAVEQQPAILFQLDEIGRLLRTLGDASRSPHLFHIATNLMKLYTSAGSLYVGDAYADPKRNKVIRQPHACLYGTTSPRWLYEGLTAESISDGFLSRIMLLEAAPQVSKQRKRKQPVPEEIIEEAGWWVDYSPGGNLSDENPSPRVIETDNAAIGAFDDLDDLAEREQLRRGEPLGTLWTRATEKARKLALIHACSADRREPRVGREAAGWACATSRYLTDRMVYLAGRWIAENPYDAKRKSVLRLITDAGPVGLTRSQIYTKTRALTTRERSDIIEALVLCDDIRPERDEETGGAPCVRYIARVFDMETSS